MGYAPGDFPRPLNGIQLLPKWQGRGIWEELNHTLRDQVREKLGRSTQPSARLLRSRFANAADSQKGLNGGKKGAVRGEAVRWTGFPA
jgi:transposase